MPKCAECGAEVYKLYPHPQDSKQEIMICEDCEYAITAQYDSQEFDPYQPKDYGSISHGH